MEQSRDKTEVRYVTGFDRFSNQPRYAKAAGLNCRFAIVQDTYRPDLNGTELDGMYFDGALWLSLIGFAQARAEEVHISLIDKLGKEMTVDAFMKRWHATVEVDRSPVSIRGRDHGALSLVIEPVYWCIAGGPMLYADSYTYEVYSAEPLGPEIEAHLAAANTGGWDLGVELSPEAMKRWQAELVEPTFWQKLWRWLA